MSDFGDRPGAALVVGGSGGLGLAIVRMLARRGSAVALTYRSEAGAASAEAAVTAAREWGVKATAYRLDVGSDEQASDVVTAVAEEFSGLHTLIQAPGPQTPSTPLSSVAPSTLAGQLADDATGFFNVVQPALPHLRHTQGSIVAVTTAATTRYPVRGGLSAAPQAAVEALVRALAAEEGRFGVRANAVGPGLLADVMRATTGDGSPDALEAARSSIPLRRFGNATDVAEAVCFLASDRAGFITGQKLDVDGGFGV